MKPVIAAMAVIVTLVSPAGADEARSNDREIRTLFRCGSLAAQFNRSEGLRLTMAGYTLASASKWLDTAAAFAAGQEDSHVQAFKMTQQHAMTAYENMNCEFLGRS
jgi:hypothetical protein